MVVAVLQQHCGIRLHAHDVFVSTVGGARLLEPASDLAVAVALASANSGVAAPSGVVAMGEIGLAGELRKVRDLPQRVAEAGRLGFQHAVVPGEPDPGGPRRGQQRRVDGMQVIDVPDIASALRMLRLTDATPRHLRATDL
jgi:DNA repair protein RadA/Sms